MTDQTYDQRRWRVRMLVLHGAMLVGPAALWLMHRYLGVKALGVCLFNRALGVDCPACGITHSVSALLRGRIEESFFIHPAGAAITGIVALMASYLLIVLLTGQKGAAWPKEVRTYSALDRLLKRS